MPASLGDPRAESTSQGRVIFSSRGAVTNQPGCKIQAHMDYRAIKMQDCKTGRVTRL